MLEVACISLVILMNIDTLNWKGTGLTLLRVRNNIE